MDKREQKMFERICKELKDFSRKQIKKSHYNKALAGIANCAQLYYAYNQFYTDDVLEDMVQDIATAIANKRQKELENYKTDKNTVLFYDGFGLDTRGIAIMYINALCKAGYHVVYMIPEKARYTQPEIHRVAEGYPVDFVYYQNKYSYYDRAIEFYQIIYRYKPKTMFFYTRPDDVSAALAFSVYKGKCNRFLIDLTDHAFWLGTKANDFFICGRDMGAFIQYFKRGISKEKLLRLDVNLLVENTVEHNGLPFDIEHCPYVFSGGELYKTLGDEKNTFYRIVEHMLAQHPQIKFLYAGAGDDIEMMKLVRKFKDRVFLISERKDFYYLIQHAVLYLNTYPMFGGMMMRYAALAGRVPVTLRHGKDADGILINQEKVGVMYDTYDEIIEDIDKLLEDDDYRHKREQLLKGTVMTADDFIRNISLLIEKNQTEYVHSFKEFDTSEFQMEFFRRFDMKNALYSTVKREDICLIRHFSWKQKIFFRKVLDKVREKF